MRERRSEVSAPIISGAPLGCRLERARCKEQQFPAGLQDAPGKGEDHIVWPVVLAYGGDRKEIRLYCQSIAVGDPCEARIWKHREVVRPIGAHALPQCSPKLRIGPTADAGIRVGRDVRAIESPKRSGERPASGQRLPAGGGVAREAAARPYQILATPTGGFVGCSRTRRGQ